MWKKLRSVLCPRLCSEKPSEGNIPFVSLAPEFDEKAHSQYVSWLESALDARKPDNVKEALYKNIALSGIYGSGKSSILQKVFEDKAETTISISLSPLAEEPDCANGQQYNNYIQHEIVKQLLYSANPRVIPLSRFRRIGSTTKLTARIAIASAVSLTLFLLLAAIGWLKNISEALPGLEAIKLPYIPGPITLLHVLLYVFGFVVVVSVLPVFLNRFQITQVSVGDASVSGTDKADNAFDTDLDEIVYFFSQEKRKRIVVFEDLDRFNEPAIFDALRELNLLLNKTPEIINRASVQFVYAIRDSIFCESGNREQQDNSSCSIEEATSDSPEAFARVKFFDLIIPVVPFLSYENAGRVARDMFEGCSIDETVLDDVARFIPDKRLLQNIRNEFEVYQHFITCDTGSSLGLDKSHLFAFLAYKNYYLSDANKLNQGKSIIDDFYRTGRMIVQDNISRILSEIRELERNRSVIEQSDAHTKSEELFEQLKNEVALKSDFCSRGFDVNRMTLTVQVNDQDFDKSRALDLWKDLVGLDDKDSICCRLEVSGYYPFTYNSSKEQIQEFLHLDANVWQWLDNTLDDFDRSLQKKRKQCELLRGADIQYLLKCDDYKTKVNGSGEVNLRKYVARVIAEPSLLFSLLEQGWINRDYMLYSTIYADSGMTARAMNFMLHVVDRNNPDYEFVLNDEDAKNVAYRVIEQNINYFSEARMLNIDLLNYLNSHAVDSEKIRKAIKMEAEYVSNFDNRYSRDFLESLYSQDNIPRVFIEMLSACCSNALIFLFGHNNVILDWCDIILSHLNSNLNYLDDERKVSGYIQRNWKKFPVMTSKELDDTAAKNLTSLCKDAGLKVETLCDVSSSLMNRFVNQSLYVFNRENLLTALRLEKNGRLPSLGELKKDNTSVYDYVICNLDAYLDLFDGPYLINDSEANLIDVLSDVYQSSAYEEAEVQEAFVDKLLSWTDEFAFTQRPCLLVVNDAAKTYVPALLRNNAVANTLKNVNWYLGELNNECDENLAVFLSYQNSLQVEESDDEALRERVAIAIINAKSDHLVDDRRITLIKNLNLKEAISVNHLDRENFHVKELYPHLLGASIIADSIYSFEYIEDFEWSLKEQYIENSKNFVEYAQDVLSSSDACRLLISKDEKINSIRETILTNSDQYLASGTVDDELFVDACCFILSQGRKLGQKIMYILNNKPLDVAHLRKLSVSGLESEWTIHLLIQLIKKLSLSDIFSVLRTVKDPQYSIFVAEDNRRNILLDDLPENHILLEVFALKNYENECLLQKDKQGQYITREGSSLVAKRNLKVWRAALKEGLND